MAMGSPGRLGDSCLPRADRAHVRTHTRRCPYPGGATGTMSREAPPVDRRTIVPGAAARSLAARRAPL